MLRSNLWFHCKGKKILIIQPSDLRTHWIIGKLHFRLKGRNAHPFISKAMGKHLNNLSNWPTDWIIVTLLITWWISNKWIYVLLDLFYWNPGENIIIIMYISEGIHIFHTFSEHLVESNQDIDIYNGLKHNQVNGLQNKRKKMPSYTHKCVYLNMHLSLSHPSTSAIATRTT